MFRRPSATPAGRVTAGHAVLHGVELQLDGFEVRSQLERAPGVWLGGVLSFFISVLSGPLHVGGKLKVAPGSVF